MLVIIEYWYDRNLKLWTLRAVDHKQDQIGYAEYCTKDQLDNYIQDMVKRYNAKDFVKLSPASL